MTSILSLSTHTNMRDAFAKLTALSDAYLAAHRKRETVNLMLSSRSNHYAGGLRLKSPVEECEVRVHGNGADADQVRQMAWFKAHVTPLVSRPAGFEGAASPLCT